MSNFPLHDAARSNDLKEIFRLVKIVGYDVNQPKSRDYRTPLHLAAHKGHVEACALLIKLGASPHSKNYFGATPLHAAAIGRSMETCKMLVCCGAKASTKTRTKDAETALSILSNARSVTYSKCHEYKRLTQILRFLRPVPHIQKIQFRVFCELVAFHRGFPVVVWSSVKEFLGGYYLSSDIIRLERERADSGFSQLSVSEDDWNTTDEDENESQNLTVDDLEDDLLIDLNFEDEEDEEEEVSYT